MKENFLIAAELGYMYAADACGDLLDESDHARWIWRGRAALRGLLSSFLNSFSTQVGRFFSGSGNATIVFLIGRALKGKIDIEKKEIFGKSYKFGSRIELFHSTILKSNQLVSQLARMLVSMRLRIVKDMRIFIGNPAPRRSRDQKIFRKK